MIPIDSGLFKKLVQWSFGAIAPITPYKPTPALIPNGDKTLYKAHSCLTKKLKVKSHSWDLIYE